MASPGERTEPACTAHRSFLSRCLCGLDDASDLEGVSLTHEAISTSAAVPLSGNFLLREDAQRNSTHNLGP